VILHYVHKAVKTMLTVRLIQLNNCLPQSTIALQVTISIQAYAMFVKPIFFVLIT